VSAGSALRTSNIERTTSNVERRGRAVAAWRRSPVAASERRGRACGVEGLKVEGLKVVEQKKSHCGSSFSATFDFKTLRLSDAAGSSNVEKL
jgi:hypothetical protein